MSKITSLIKESNKNRDLILVHLPSKIVPIIPTIFLVSILFILSLSVTFAGVAEVISPISTKVGDGETIYLGKIGPGQMIDVVVSGKTTTGGRWGIGGTWQILRVLEVPSGWEGFDSKEMATQMKAAIKASPTAQDGRYIIKLRLEEDVTKQQQLGSVTFYVTVDISKDVMSSLILKKTLEIGVGQPARYDIVIENKGKASDVFEISSAGVSGWNYKKIIHVPAEKSVTTFYEFTSNEEKSYEPTLTIKSQSSDLIKSEHQLKLTVKSDVVGDIKATKNGVLIFPTVLEPLYTLLGLIGYTI